MSARQVLRALVEGALLLLVGGAVLVGVLCLG